MLPERRGRRLLEQRGSAVRGAKGTEEGLWLHTWAPVAHVCTHRAPTSTG